MRRLTILPLLAALAACASGARRVDPERAKAARESADVAYDASRYEDAIDGYSRAIELNPDYADAYHWRGNAWRKLADDREAAIAALDALGNAARDYSAAINRNPMHYEAYFNRGCVLMAVARPKDAVPDFLQCTQIRTKDPQPHLLLGDIYENRFEDKALAALEHYEKYVEKGGTDPDIVEKVRQFRELKKSAMPAPSAKTPTRDEEGAAKEQHDRIMALVGQGKRQEAFDAVEELLSKYGHTDYVKRQMNVFQALRNAMKPK